MTVKITVVRLASCDQIQPWGLRQTRFQYIEILSAGWASGSRTRSKKLSLSKARAYANKLAAGKWIDDDEYDFLYEAIDRLLLQAEKRGCFLE